MMAIDLKKDHRDGTTLPVPIYRPRLILPSTPFAFEPWTDSIVHHGVEKGRTGPNWNSLARHFAPLGTVKGNFNIRHGLIPAPTAGATQPNVRISNTPILPRKRVGRNSERVRNSEHSRVAVGGGRRRPGPEGPQADVYTSGVRSRSSLKPVISPPAGQREPFGPLPAVVYLIHPAR
jgi:hypothetical protein